MKTRDLMKIAVMLSVIFFLSNEIIAQDTAQKSSNAIVHTMDDAGLQWGSCPDFMPKGCEIAILHGDPSQKNVDVFFKVPENSKIPNHAHTSAERMVLVAGEMDVTYQNEQTQKLKAGSYAYGPAKKPHTAHCGNAGPCVLFIAFEDPLDAFAVEK